MKKIYLILISFFLALFIMSLIVGLYYVAKIYRSDIDPVVYYSPKLTTEIYDKHGELIANLFEDEHRLYTPFQDIPPRIVEALVAIEDTTFFEHFGINIEAIFRATIKVAIAGKAVEGASTITQQLVKNLLLTRHKTITRKINEAILAIKLERHLSKEDILERYLNEIYFGHGFYGVKTASMGYFRKDLKSLTLKEVALLMGLPRAPSFYDPTKHYSLSLARANLVLGRMYTLGWIGEDEYQKSLQEKPIVYDDTLTKNQAPYVVDYVISELSKDYPDLKSGGYKIFTTIDLQVQNFAREALEVGYKLIKKRVEASLLKDEKEKIKSEESFDGNFTYSRLAQLNGAIVVMQQNNGEVLALVGGVNYKKSTFNRATQAKRQLGSSFKPFIYLAAYDLGYSPASMIPDISRTYKYTTKEEEMIWKPSNYEDNFIGLMTTREAVVHSRNLATINLVSGIGIDTLYDKLNSFGFLNLPRDLSIALGSHSMSPLELSGYYTMISNYGEKVEPLIIKKVEDRYFQSKEYKYQSDIVTSKEQAYLMIDVLKETVQRGTGRGVKSKEIEFAGKTGTTNDNRDAWFCGFSPTLQVVVWMGNDDYLPIGERETGGRVAAPVFREFFKRYINDKPEIDRFFQKPDGVYEVLLPNGEKEIFTNTSKPPKVNKIENLKDEIIF